MSSYQILMQVLTLNKLMRISTFPDINALPDEGLVTFHLNHRKEVLGTAHADSSDVEMAVWEQVFCR